MWRAVLGNAVIALATIVLLVELGEFAMLAYVWGFTTGEKSISGFDNSVVYATTLITIVGTSLLSVTSLVSIHRRCLWPSVQAFSIAVGFVVFTQLFFLLLSMVNFNGEWLNDFFHSKSPTFTAGLVAALMLAAACLVIRPWENSLKGNI